MIRALQMRVNTRTGRYAKMIEGEQADSVELVEALKRLAQRQQRIYRVTTIFRLERTSEAADHDDTDVLPDGRGACRVAGAGAVAEAAWQPPKAQEVKAQALAWLEAKNVDAATRAKADALWSALPRQASEDDLLVRVARTIALIDPNAAKLLALCSQPRSQLLVPSQSWLGDRSVSPLFAANLRLLYAQWLVHESLFDEAQEQLFGLTPADVVAPASLLFYQSVVYHALLNKESGLKSIGSCSKASGRARGVTWRWLG